MRSMSLWEFFYCFEIGSHDMDFLNTLLEWVTNNPFQAALIHTHPDQEFDETAQFVFQMEGSNEISCKVTFLKE